MAACGPGASGDSLWPPPVITTPAFDAARFTATLAQLQRAFEDRGRAVTARLQAGLDEATVRARTTWFPVPLPTEIVTLYGWHDGQTPGSEPANSLVFRDCPFINLDRARDVYRTMLGAYGPAAALIDADLARCFPIAEFEGATLVVPCGVPPGGAAQLRPVVEVFEGIMVHFYSVERMVETCLAWVRDPSYGPHGLAGPVELEIWRQHNPGIFPGADPR